MPNVGEKQTSKVRRFFLVGAGLLAIVYLAALVYEWISPSSRSTLSDDLVPYVLLSSIALLLCTGLRGD